MGILVTGGAGYIGSHTCVELLNQGYEVIVLDNFYNSKPESLNRIKQISGKSFKFYEGDILDRELLKKIFADEKVDSVIHFAGLKAVGESVRIPLKYYHNNITGTLILLECMLEANVKNLVFSSSATVYGYKNPAPYFEEMEIGNCTNPYGQTKFMIEQILKDLCNANPDFNMTILRYFNPIGAHVSGLIGEDPSGIPNNLMPFITQVAVGKLKKLNIYGNDYDTPDGTGLRDYIHVVDLGRGHLCALKNLSGYKVYNLGTGKGTSVLELVSALEKVSGKNIPYELVTRREGDIASCYANVDKARKELGFEAEFDIERMCEDSWRWQSENPNGM